MNRLARLIVTVAVAFAMTGCASNGNPQDPLEGFNRAMFDFNDTLDRAALKPVAEAYQAVLPNFVQTGVGNFFDNLGDVWIAVNNFLQGKIEAGGQDVVRFVANSTFGVLGLFDVASDAGLPKHNEDLGQTLGAWGVPSGPYVVLPFFGPSTLRDTTALPVDIIYGDIWTYVEPVHWRNTGVAVRFIDRRAALLDASSLMEDAALDRYQFLRDAYMQRRLNQVYDGDPPAESNNGKESQD